MPMRIAAALLNAAVDVLADAPDAGASNGYIEVREGSPPATFTDPATGTLLATIPFDDPAFGAGGATNVGEAEALGVPITVSGAADGTIGYIRVYDSDDTPLWDDDNVGTSGTRVIFNTTTVSTGVDVELTSYTLTAAPTTLTP